MIIGYRKCQPIQYNKTYRGPLVSPGGTNIEPFKSYSAAKTGLKHLKKESMIIVPDEIKEEIAEFRIPGINTEIGKE
jgi:hypothetical protein